MIKKDRLLNPQIQPIALSFLRLLSTSTSIATPKRRTTLNNQRLPSAMPEKVENVLPALIEADREEQARVDLELDEMARKREQAKVIIVFFFFVSRCAQPLRLIIHVRPWRTDLVLFYLPCV